MPGNKIIAVVGAPGSKMSEVARAIALRSGTGCTIIDAKSYLRALTSENYNDFDPSCYDFEKLESDLHNLKLGNPVVLAGSNLVEDSDSEYVLNEVEPFEPANVLIVHGSFAMYTDRLKLLADKGVFVEADLDLCFSRAYQANELPYAGSEAEARLQWNSKIVPVFNNFVLPQRSGIQYVVDSNTLGMVDDLSIDGLGEIITNFRLFDENSAEKQSNNPFNPGVGHFGIGC